MPEAKAPLPACDLPVRRVSRFHPNTVLAAVVTAIAGYIALRFVWLDGLPSFADDGVSYLIMARYLTPFFPRSEIITQAFLYEHYPPLFPALLALTGGSHSFVAAHLTVIACFLGALLLVYFWSARTLDSTPLGLLVLLIFAASPGSWVNLLGVLSENLYLLLSLLVLYHYDARVAARDFGWRDSLVLAALLALVLSTRTVGVSLIAAYLLTQAFERRSLRALLRPRTLAPALLPVLAAAAWYAARPTLGTSSYVEDIARLLGDLTSGRLDAGGWSALLLPQLSALYDAWFVAFLVYWRSEYAPTYIIVALLGVLALYGLVIRLARNRLDAWYVLVHLLVLLVWPYPGQFTRFIYAILPMLILHAAYALIVLATRVNQPSVRAWFARAALILVLVSILPTTAFLHARASYRTLAPSMDYTRVTQFYRLPGLVKAENAALWHENLRLDMERIKATTPPDAAIMWYTPNFISLLAQRRALGFPEFTSEKDFLRAVAEAAPEYVFLARLHPRDTREQTNGLAMLPFVANFAAPVWVSHAPDSDEVLSVLLKVDREKLDRLVAAR